MLAAVFLLLSLVLQTSLASLTVGVNGPVLLEDTDLVDKLAIFNRGRIPERPVFANGVFARGEFTVTKSMRQYTRAGFLQTVGQKTPIAGRWSMLVHGRHSPEFIRDVRGFSLKFYTEEGNYDIVGSNFPVWFLKQANPFPDLMHALRPNPVSGVQEFRRIWDFCGFFNESVHMMTYLLDDNGIPLSYRHIDGYAVHAFTWINAMNDTRLIKYRWKSEQGTTSFISDVEAQKNDFQFHTRDLHEAIQQKEFPRWRLQVQILDTSVDLGVNPLDPTKVWPEEIVPWIEVGVMEFDQNGHEFLENEMSAFSPGRLVPGILPSNDEVLQARLFAYSDAQMHRLGVNHQMLPVNEPLNGYIHAHVHGNMNFRTPMRNTDGILDVLEDIQFVPNSRNDPRISSSFGIAEFDSEELSGSVKVNQQFEVSEFQQAQKRYLSWDSGRRNRFAQRVISRLADHQISENTLSKWLAHWSSVDTQLGTQIRNGVNALRNPIAANDSVQSQHLIVALAASLVASISVGGGLFFLKSRASVPAKRTLRLTRKSSL